MAKINVKNTELTVVTIGEADYICITDLARYKNPEHSDDVVKNWLRNRNTIELLGIWIKELGFTRCILETGKKLLKAISLYQKKGYSRIANYGQYECLGSNVCFEKIFRKRIKIKSRINIKEIWK